VQASHWDDFSLKIAPGLTRPDYTVAATRKSLLTVRRPFPPLWFVYGAVSVWDNRLSMEGCLV